MWGLAIVLLALGAFFGFKAVQGISRGKMMARGGMVYRRGSANSPTMFWFWVGLSAFVAMVASVTGAYVLIFPT